MSTYNTKGHLIGGGDVVRAARATLYSYTEAMLEYPAEIIGTSLTLRASNTSTGASLERSIVFNAINVHNILADINASYEVALDNSTPPLFSAKIDDSRLSITLVHDGFDTLEVLANPISDLDDAINHLGFHPTPHPSGRASVGDVSRALSSRQNRALNSGGFLVRGEDRTSTGINRVLSLLSDNNDALEVQLRNALEATELRDMVCYADQGVVTNVVELLRGGELIGATLREPNIVPTFSGTPSDILTSLSELVFSASFAPTFNDSFNDKTYDFLLQQETDAGYAFGVAHGRTAPALISDYSVIALSEDAKTNALATLVTEGAQSASGPLISSSLYWGRADYLGTMHGPRYDVPQTAHVIDHYTLRFSDRVEHLDLVRHGDIVVTDKGVFNVDFIGDDRKTVGVLPFSGSYTSLLATYPTYAEYLHDKLRDVTTLTSGDTLGNLVIIKSAIGFKGEYYAQGRFGWPNAEGTKETFRVRTLSPKAKTAPGDDIKERTYARMLQELIDPYTESSTLSVVHSVRTLFATGGLLKLPRVYALPSTLEGTRPIDYLQGSHNFGPIRVGQTNYTKTTTPMSIFSGVGSVPGGVIDAELLYENDIVYAIAHQSIERGDIRRALCLDVDKAILEHDVEAARRVDAALATISAPRLEPAVRGELSAEDRERVILFYNDLLQASGRSLIPANLPIEIDTSDGLSVKVPSTNPYINFSEQDLGRVFLLTFVLGNVKKHVRARMHTWTSPKTCRLLPINDLDFDVEAYPTGTTISPTVGYANLGYGALTNTVIPEQADIFTDAYPSESPKTSTAYTHIYPGTSTALTVHTAYSTAPRMFTRICALDEQSGDKRLYALNRSYIIIGEGGHEELSDVDTADINYNIPNRSPAIPIDQLTFVPFIRSDDQTLLVHALDLFSYALSTHLGWATLTDFIAHSTHASSFRDITAELDLQTQRCEHAAYLNHVTPTSEFIDGDNPLHDDIEESLRAAQSFVQTAEGGYYNDFEELYEATRFGDPLLALRRGASKPRAEDAIVLKDVTAESVVPLIAGVRATRSVALNCEDVLLDNVLRATTTLGHLRDSIDSSVANVGTRTSNYALILRARSGDDVASALVTTLIDALTDEAKTLAVTHFVGIDQAQASIRNNTRSWFLARIDSTDGSFSEQYFAVDRSGFLRIWTEYVPSGDAFDTTFGAFTSWDAHYTPTFQYGQTTLNRIGRASVTAAFRVTTSPIPGIGEAPLPVAVLHTSLKSSDIPYAPTLCTKSLATFTPVSKELGRTLSSALSNGSVYSSVDDIFASTLSSDTAETSRYLVTNGYPATKRFHSGVVDKASYDTFSNTGVDITIYDGEPGFDSGAREDGIKVSSLTRGYTEVIGDGNFERRKKTAVHVSSEETVIGVKVSHKGIAETSNLDGTAAPVIDIDNRVFKHLAFAGLLVEASGSAWSSPGKSLTSMPTSLTSILGVTRDLRLDSGLPVMAGEKIDVVGDAIGLYIPWRGAELGSIGEATRQDPNVVNTPKPYNITKGFRNASLLVEGDVGLPNMGAVPDYDGERSAIAAFGRVSVQGLLDLYGDLYATRFHHDNLGSNRITAGVVSHLNPVSAPRAQNTLYVNGLPMSDTYVLLTAISGEPNYTVIQNLYAPPNDAFNRLLYPTHMGGLTDSASVPRNGDIGLNRNPMGITQQQLGERNTTLRIIAAVAPSAGVRYVSGNTQGIDETHYPVLPTFVKADDTLPTYTLIAAGYHAAIASDPSNAPEGLSGEYLLFAFSRPLTLWGDAYLGRTVVVKLDATNSAGTITTGHATGVISKIVDSPTAGLTFVAVTPVTSRFDRRTSYMLLGREYYEYPNSFEDVVSAFIEGNVIQSISSDSASWEEWFLANNDVGLRPSNPISFDTVELDLRVQGREWVLNSSQAFISDTLYVCNDIGGSSEIKVYRDNTLSIESSGDITLTANGRINLDNTEGVFENGKPLISPTEVTASGYIVLAAPMPLRQNAVLHADLKSYPVRECALFATMHHDPFTDPITGEAHPFFLRGIPTTLEDTHLVSTTNSDDPENYGSYLRETAVKSSIGFDNGDTNGYFESQPPIVPSAFVHSFSLYDATDLINWFFDLANTIPWESTNDQIDLPDINGIPTPTARNLANDPQGPYTNSGTVRLAYAGDALAPITVADGKITQGANFFTETPPPIVISCEPWHHSNDFIESTDSHWRVGDVSKYVAVVFFMNPDYLAAAPTSGMRCYGFITDADVDPWEIKSALAASQLGQHTAREALSDLKIYASLYGLRSTNNLRDATGFSYGEDEVGNEHVNDWRQFVHYNWEYAEELRNNPTFSWTTRAQPFMDNLLGPATVESDIKWVATSPTSVPTAGRYLPAVAVTKDTWTYMGPAAGDYSGQLYYLEAYQTFMKCINSIRISATSGNHQPLYSTQAIQGPTVFKYTHAGHEYVVSDATLTSDYVADDGEKRGFIEPSGMTPYYTLQGNIAPRLVDAYRGKASIVRGMSADLKEFAKDGTHFVDTARWFDVGRAHTKWTLDYLLSLDFSVDHANIPEYRHMAGSPLWGVLTHYPRAAYPTYLSLTFPQNLTMVDSVPMIVGVRSSIDNYYNSFLSQFGTDLNVGTRGSAEYLVYYQSGEDVGGIPTSTGIIGRYVEPPTLRTDVPGSPEGNTSLYGAAGLRSALQCFTQYVGDEDVGVDMYRFNVGHALTFRVPPSYVPACSSNFPAMVFQTFGVSDVEIPLAFDIIDYPTDTRTFTSVDAKYGNTLFYNNPHSVLTADNYSEAYTQWFNERFKVNNAMLLDNVLKGSLASYELGKLTLGAKAVYPAAKNEPAKYLSKSVDDFTDIGELRVHLDEAAFREWYEGIATYRRTYGDEENIGTPSLVIPITVTLKIRRA